MGKGKGKVRAHHDEAAVNEAVNEARADEPEAPSIASRVAASASGLTRSVFRHSNGSELNSSVADSLANTGKGQSSSAGHGSAWAESSRAQQQTTPQTTSSIAFKAGPSEEHIKQSENEFSSFLDGIDTFSPSQNLENGYSAGLNDGFRETWPRSQITRDGTQPRPVMHRTVAEQENHDGEEVLSILSAPGGINTPLEAPREDDEDYDWGLTQEQISQLRAMTKDILPPPETHIAISPDHPLNLVPQVEETTFIHGQSQTSVEAWREQWQDVLTRYTDEVWGGLLPLVREARKEVEGFQSGESPTMQPKALRRLEAILGHLRQY
jgi:hypothetical protein